MIRYETEGRVATVTLDRPERRNALNASLVEALQEALAEAEADDRVRVVVLTGAGSVFSAGADLAELEAMQSATPMENAEDARRLASLLERIYLHPKPVVARVNGAAVGGGCGLAVACDVAVADADATMGFPEVRLGFVPAIVAVFVVRKIGETRARDLLLRGRLVDAAEAERIGLVARAVPRGELAAAVDAVAHELATETSASAVALTKQLMAQLPGMGLREALSFAAQANAFARGTADCRAGVDAFLRRTVPPWKEGA